MPQAPCPVVVVVYRHPLLGVGLARWLAAEAGVRAAPVPLADPAAVGSALAAGPAVVLLEAAEPRQRAAVAAAAPHATVIAVTATIDVAAPSVEQLLRVVRRTARRDGRTGVETGGPAH